MKLQAPKTTKPKPPNQRQMSAIHRIAKSDPPVVCVSIQDKGLHYSIGNGDRISGGMVLGMISRGYLKSNNDGMGSLTPQSYRLVFQPVADVQETGE